MVRTKAAEENGQSARSSARRWEGDGMRHLTSVGNGGVGTEEAEARSGGGDARQNGQISSKGTVSGTSSGNCLCTHRTWASIQACGGRQSPCRRGPVGQHKHGEHCRRPVMNRQCRGDDGGCVVSRLSPLPLRLLGLDVGAVYTSSVLSRLSSSTPHHRHHPPSPATRPVAITRRTDSRTDTHLEVRLTLLDLGGDWDVSAVLFCAYRDASTHC